MLKKINFTSLLIGFLLAATLLLALGNATRNDSRGRYEFGSAETKYAYILDTTTGEIFYVETKLHFVDGTGPIWSSLGSPQNISK